MITTKRPNTLHTLAAISALSIFSSYASADVASPSALFAQSNVGFTQTGGQGVNDFDGQTTTDGTPTSATATNQTFTGMDRTGATRTLTFNGLNQASASFGRLHLYASGTVTNNYYNAANPKADDGTGTLNLATGSPDGFASLGFAGFTDTLQFGGNLQAGYQARYLFHVDGTNSGDGGAADLSVGIAGNPDEAFFDFDPGFFSTTWATQTYAINGSTPQTIHVQFSNQFTMNTFDYADGVTVSGASDFSSTLTLLAVQILDGDGNPVSDVTVMGDSGTQYPTSVPEPTTLALLLPVLLTLTRRRRHS